MINHCKTCGYKGSKIHDHIYDCCDYLDKDWMKKWMMNPEKKNNNLMKVILLDGVRNGKETDLLITCDWMW